MAWYLVKHRHNSTFTLQIKYAVELTLNWLINHGVWVLLLSTEWKLSKCSLKQVTSLCLNGYTVPSDILYKYYSWVNLNLFHKYRMRHRNGRLLRGFFSFFLCWEIALKFRGMFAQGWMSPWRYVQKVISFVV